MTDKELVKKQRKTICKGCKTFFNTGFPGPSCNFLPVVDVFIYCPCSICLIKGICIDGCELIRVYNVVMSPVKDKIFRHVINLIWSEKLKLYQKRA